MLGRGVSSGMELFSIMSSSGLLLLSILAGSMLFFSFVMAPLIFIKLDIDVAGRFVRAVFPWYYLLVIVLAALAGALIAPSWPLNASLLGLVTVSTVYCRQSLMPAINNYRDRSLSGEKGSNKIFDKLHRRSEILNGLQLLAVFAVLVHLVFVG
jgi:hypothetical protein